MSNGLYFLLKGCYNAIGNAAPVSIRTSFSIPVRHFGHLEPASIAEPRHFEHATWLQGLNTQEDPSLGWIEQPGGSLGSIKSGNWL